MNGPLFPSDRVLARLMGLHPKKIDLSLGRMERLLARLGNPERRLPPVFHVGGTNGKGSTAAYLRALLEAAGKRVHVYTSPHLVRFAERIRLAGTLIGEDHLIEVLEACEQANGPDAPITYFEITTAAAFLAFSQTPADAVILEVGLGGRLDATNVIDRPLVSAITPVSMDHEEFLGQTLARIAAEKAGIAKAGVPLVLGPQRQDAFTVIEKKAAVAGACLVAHNRDWQVREGAEGFDFEDHAGVVHLPSPALDGPHQIMNAGLAIACLRAQTTFDITCNQLAAGLTEVIWPARLQDISAAPGLKGLFPASIKMWLDGGHNPAAGDVLATVFAARQRPLYLITGMMANKDCAGFLKPLSGLVTTLYGIAIPGEACHPAPRIVSFGRLVGIEARPADSLENALASIAHTVPDGTGADVLICGSLYLAGYALRQFDLLPT